MTWLIEFSIFLILQALFINGVKYCFEKDSIFYRMSPGFFERNKGKAWTYPVYACVRCMGGVYGAITFWPTVIIMYGFHWQEVPLSILNIGCLITLNFIIYKKM
jgi:hypothetical protein